jgi:hypothetical protein
VKTVRASQSAGRPALYDEAGKNGWAIIGMKKDWRRIFAFA